MIMGYRSSDAERERSPAPYSGPGIRSMTTAGHCGTVPDSVDRDRILLYCQLNPAGPGSRGNQGGVECAQGIFPAFMQDAPVVCW
jgi:hypothetical protein